MDRRGFLGGLLAAPAVITTPGLLMPVKPFGFTEAQLEAELRAIWNELRQTWHIQRVTPLTRRTNIIEQVAHYTMVDVHEGSVPLDHRALMMNTAIDRLESAV